MHHENRVCVCIYWQIMAHLVRFVNRYIDYPFLCRKKKKALPVIKYPNDETLLDLERVMVSFLTIYSSESHLLAGGISKNRAKTEDDH